MSPNQLRTGTISAVHNSGKFFYDCLDGLLSQTHLPDIIAIIDDGSTDDSVNKVYSSVEELSGRWQTIQPKMDNSHHWQTHYATLNKNGKHIKILFSPQKKNKGPAAARNIGLKLLFDTQVDIAFVADSDDVYYPTKIEKSLEVFNNHEHVGLVYSDYDTYNEKTKQIAREYKEPFTYKRLLEECIVSNNSAYRMEAIGQVGPYDESLFGPEDYDMWLRISEMSGVVHIPEALYKYRITGENLTITTPSQKFAQHVQRVKQKVMERRNAQ